MSDTKLTLYAVRSKDGKWFRRKGYSGWGENWVDKLDRARIYTKIGHARQQVTFFAEHYPSYGTPEVVALKVTSMETIDETERIQKKHAREERSKGIRRLKMASEHLERARKEFEEAHKELTR